MKSEIVSTKKAALAAWENAVRNRSLSPLMKTVGEVVAGVPDNDNDFSVAAMMRAFAKRIALNTGHNNLAALRYSDWAGEWEVRNADLSVWSYFEMWIGRFAARENEHMTRAFVSPIGEALAMKRKQQARDRFVATGLTEAHCSLLEQMLWDVDTGRGDWISLHVQGKRPFGNSSIEYDIYEYAGWEMEWPDEDGPSEEQRERAWNLFDELAFAAPHAATHARQYLLTEEGKQHAEMIRMQLQEAAASDTDALQAEGSAR